MKYSQSALLVFLATAASAPWAVEAFNPVSLRTSGSLAASQLSLDGRVAFVSRREHSRGFSRLQMSTFLDDEDDDEDDEDEDEDDEDGDYVDFEAYSKPPKSFESPFSGLKIDPSDPNPVIKPRPSKYFFDEYDDKDVVPDDQLVQTMSTQERTENLEAMRQIKKNDLIALRERRDYAGYLEASGDLDRRTKKDPWFGINKRIMDAVMLGEPDEKVEYLQKLSAKVGGPPPGVELEPRGFANPVQVYDVSPDETVEQRRIDEYIRRERAAKGRAMALEMKKNEDKAQKQWEEDLRFPGVRQEREAKARRERMMRKLSAELDEERKKKKERAKEILGTIPDIVGSERMDDLMKIVRDDFKKDRRRRMGQVGYDDEDGDDNDDLSSSIRDTKKSSADKAREAAAAEASGGRPRLPGDKDVTRGELGSLAVESSSTTATGPLTVEVSSSYDKELSDPPMRKHCFEYTIRITNNSPTETIQLLGRRFEIQTVGSSMKDIVQGEGVTGSQPVLKPGEVFEYTSNAPLSVRPIGTTIIAARMKGEYRYVVLEPGQESAGSQTGQGAADETAELGMFHFIFPEDQRVLPFRNADQEDDEEDDDDEDEDDDGDDVVDATPASTSSGSTGSSAAASAKASSPAAAPLKTVTTMSSKPGDDDMKSGDIAGPVNDSAEVVTEKVRVHVASSYRPERSEAPLEKYAFAYNVRITNEFDKSIQLVTRKFEIQTIGSANKDVVEGPGVTGRQPILKPGESFEYTSTAPLSVKPMLDKTQVVARMRGEFGFMVLADDGITPMSSTPLQATVGTFHFILPKSDKA